MTMKLTIDRAKWLRGEGSGSSLLLRERDGKQCCLGQLGFACGLTSAQMMNTGAPSVIHIASESDPDSESNRKAIWSRQVKEAGLLFLYDDNLSPYCFDLMETNDDRELDEDYREERLTYLFAKIGIEVEFIN
jgi:hypothetical protein